jgi:hypothetical protein
MTKPETRIQAKEEAAPPAPVLHASHSDTLGQEVVDGVLPLGPSSLWSPSRRGSPSRARSPAKWFTALSR